MSFKIKSEHKFHDIELELLTSDVLGTCLYANGMAIIQFKENNILELNHKFLKYLDIDLVSG